MKRGKGRKENGEVEMVVVLGGGVWGGGVWGEAKCSSGVQEASILTQNVHTSVSLTHACPHMCILVHTVIKP